MSKTIFVHIKNPRTGFYYDSYDDYFRLVKLSGFQECDLEQVKPMSANTYIFTLNFDGFDQKPIPDNYFPKGRTARYIHHQIERENIIDERFDEVWLSDKSMPELKHKKARYVILGGHPDFMEPLEVPKQFDFYHACYLAGRRVGMINELAMKGYKFCECPITWPEKNNLMQQSRVGLALHQHDHSKELIEPLRYTVFSCMKLPILAEKSVDPSPYFVYSYEEFLKGNNFTEILNWQDNWETITQKHTFRKEILKALK